MKKFYLLLLLSFFLQKTNAQWVTIPDPNFVTFLQQNYPSCMNGNQMDTQCSAIVNETILNCSNKNISDLTGIEYFSNIESLYCNNNNLASLSQLPNNLIELNCSFNQLTSLPSLPGNLYTLGCWNNFLTSLPSLPSTLFDLYANNNQLTSLPSLPSSLAGLLCYGNLLTSLPPLPNSLWQLVCYDNFITSLPLLPNSLWSLVCFNNQITSLPTLPNSLSSLACGNNQLSNLPTLPATLTYLTCEWNQLVSIPELPDTLNYFYVNNNSNLTCLPQLKNINKFHYGGTGISCLPNNPNLFGSNPIANPPLGTYPICSSTISAQITSTTTSLCGVSSIILSADTGTGYSYQWQLNGNNISGATSQTYDASVAGNYSVIVTLNCALDTSNTITITSGAAPSAAIITTGPVNFCSGGSVILDANTGTGLTYQWQVDGNNISGATSSSYSAINSGNYSVIVTNNCGNSISNIITINVTSAPGSAGAIAGPTFFCRHTTQSFSVTPVAGATNYVWSVPPQAIITAGQGTNSIIVNFKVKQGNVTVKAANQCGAGPLSVLPVQVVKCAQANNAVMRENKTSDQEISIYPNPATSEVTIQFYSDSENEFILNLYDIHGRLIREQNSIAIEGINEFTFNLEFLSKGIYMIELKTADDRMMNKLIVQ